MITCIKLPEFRGYTKEALKEFLSLAPTRFFDIVLPKTSHMNSMGARAVFEDFSLALHLSQGLKRISHDILCMVTPVRDPGSFSLLILADSLEALAALLEPYVNGFGADGRPTAQLLSLAAAPEPAPGEALASNYYHDVYMALKDSNCSPYALADY
ncbi:hypothetical protein [Flavisolibacter ginsengisoli]|jgi:hypothetical protein|uniref:Uncharacterized protein n=1 Tax=Flavisolibacter ginsengisoli DSM 18119 TaxID=1121884 RepID=A0A1M5GNX5_9BACT|nr:hypothetical protein [Flavisolibacter ginsengisoli]SHG05367.1 hypothetical protein SAMN02745131_04193 [Flavisolibacter ginsengisoli DSM 18119]